MPKEDLFFSLYKIYFFLLLYYKSKGLVLKKMLVRQQIALINKDLAINSEGTKH
jgi:hypothetical protein